MRFSVLWKWVISHDHTCTLAHFQYLFLNVYFHIHSSHPLNVAEICVPTCHNTLSISRKILELQYMSENVSCHNKGGFGHTYLLLFVYQFCIQFRQMMERMTWRKAHSCWRSTLWKSKCTLLRKTTRNWKRCMSSHCILNLPFLTRL